MKYERTTNKQDAVPITETIVPADPPVVVLDVSNSSLPSFTESEQQCADQLEARGIAPPAARRLIKDFGESECRKQLSALAMRNAKDAASVLCASITGKWSVKRPEKPLQPPAATVRATDSVPYTPPAELCTGSVSADLAELRRKCGFREKKRVD